MTTSRRPGLVWTAEDAAIWRRFGRRPMFGALVLWSLADDARDFEFMRNLERLTVAGRALAAMKSAYVNVFGLRV